MAENNDRTAAGGLAVSELETRLDALERRLERDDSDHRRVLFDSGRRRDELDALREAVDDLAADVLDLHNQMEKLVSACERILAGGRGALATRDAGSRRLRSSTSALRRVTRRAVTGTIGVARRILRPGSGAAPPALGLEIGLASSPARRAPTLALVLPGDGDRSDDGLPPDLRALAGDGVVIAAWDRAAQTAVVDAGDGELRQVEARDRAALAAVLAADVVAELEPPLPRLDPVVVGLCRWTVASENLPLRVHSGEGAARPGVRWELTPTDRWTAAESARQAPLVKVVGGRAWHPTGDAASLLVGAGNGRGYLPGAGLAGTLEHEVAPLEGVAGLASDDGSRPAVLVLASAAGYGIVATLVRSLGETRRFVVVTTGAPAGVAASDRALTELGAEVYPVAAWLEPEVWPSLVADLVRTNQIGTVLRLGRPLEIELPGDPRPRLVDLPFAAAEIDVSVDAVLAVGAGIAGAARAAGLATSELLAAPEIAGELPGADRLATVRSAYGVPDDAILVLAVAELVPDRRPEDIAAVAYRLRDRRDVHVLLVGQGPLAGTVNDIAAHFRLERFSLSPVGHPIADLVAASDCVLSAAERDPWPEAVAAALALGRHVVATDIDGVRELVAAAGGDRCVLCPPCDLDGLAAGVVETLERHRKARVTKKAWAAAKARSRKSLATIVRVLDGAASGGEEAD